ncbi:MAG TPA: putative O-glycosylation ligase, exosortase A system-associated, partial [Alphaproteobacteria bacterium]|nr:putative O-glycosylation ligase, exosortase A system-associated [Alphaproteobacteria bacterium]
HGYVGLAIFLSILIGAFYYGGRTIRLARGDPDLLWARDLGSMIQVSLVGYAVAGAFLNLATFDLYYHLIAIIVITDLLVRTALAHKNSEVPAKSDEGILTTMSPAVAKPKFTVLSR